MESLTVLTVTYSIFMKLSCRVLFLNHKRPILFSQPSPNLCDKLKHWNQLHNVNNALDLILISSHRRCQPPLQYPVVWIPGLFFLQQITNKKMQRAWVQILTYYKLPNWQPNTILTTNVSIGRKICILQPGTCCSFTDSAMISSAVSHLQAIECKKWLY